MFTTPMFYIGWVIIASLPLMVAIIAPQKSATKSLLLWVSSLLLLLSCAGCMRNRKTTTTAGIMVFILTAAVSINFPALLNGEHQNLSITLAINADTLKNFLQL